MPRKAQATSQHDQNCKAVPGVHTHHRYHQESCSFTATFTALNAVYPQHVPYATPPVVATALGGPRGGLRRQRMRTNRSITDSGCTCCTPAS